jgi:3-hydroxyisobutyrate dehydrogenase-like beta-hydroxyacid dehydrogenase
VAWAADKPAAAVAGSDAVFTMPANPKALDQVLSGDDGLLGALRPGQVLIDMSTSARW